MNKIKLTKGCKRILKELKANAYVYAHSDNEDLNCLIQENLVKAVELIGDNYGTVQLSDRGNAYLHIYPKLKNPSIWDDRKYLITTAIAIAALIVSLLK